MQQKEVTELTKEELLKEKKKIKTINIGTAVFIGVLLGISIYSAVNNGLELATFLPLFFLSFLLMERDQKKLMKN